MAIAGKIVSLREILKDPERFLIDRFYRSHPPQGFRIELFTARKYTLALKSILSLKSIYLNRYGSWLDKWNISDKPRLSRVKEAVKNFRPIPPPKPVFCPYCEKRVVPKRLYKLDIGDIVLFFFTAGFWGIFLFVISLFRRRCPTCDYSLRGFKSLHKHQ